MNCVKCGKSVLSGIVTCFACRDAAPADPQALAGAIAYFEDAVREGDEIMAECGTDVQAALVEQKEYFATAIAAMRALAK